MPQKLCWRSCLFLGISIWYELLLNDGVLVEVGWSSELRSVLVKSDEDRRGMQGYDEDELTLRVRVRQIALVVGPLGVASRSVEE